jgi:hypothetical protein
MSVSPQMVELLIEREVTRSSRQLGVTPTGRFQRMDLFVLVLR